MSDIRTIKRKIKSVQNIQQICRAMKMVASVRIRNAERRMKQSQPYTIKYREVVRELVGQAEEVFHPLMEIRDVDKTLLLVITSDKGLCGSYNASILQESLKFLSKNSGKEIIIKVLGTKGHRFLTRRKFNIQESIRDWQPSFPLAYRLSREFQESFLSKKIDQVLCLYSFPVSTMTQKPRLITLLPLSEIEGQCDKKCHQLIYEPPPRKALDYILHQYLDVILYQILMEAHVSELGARLRAMTNATDNADELIGDLRLKFFRARQESITNEILEVTSGADALKS